MYYILYVSQAERQMTDEELSELLSVSRRNNQKSGITGLLIYKLWKHENRANFLQYLEGPRDQVQRSFEKIMHDSRHHTVICLEKGEINNRNFRDWEMGFKNLSSEEIKTFPGFKDINEDSFDPEDFAEYMQSALETMKLFYESD